MNILLVGGAYIKDAMQVLGHNVVNANYAANSDLVLAHPFYWKKIQCWLHTAEFEPDVVIYVDNGNLPLILDPQNIPVLSIFYSIDTYCNPWHIPYAHSFDHSLVGQKDFVQFFIDDDQKADWFPLFCSRKLCEMQIKERDIPISFVGTIGHKNNPKRGPFLQKFKEYQHIEVLSGDFLPVFSRSEIVLNQTAFGEINFRCFEAMGLGCALLMEKCGNGLEDLFHPSIDILPVYKRNDAREAANIASIYLEHKKALNSIALKGRELIYNKHTDLVRAEQILAKTRELMTQNASMARLSNPASFANHTATAFGMLASELESNEMEVYRDFFHTIAVGRHPVKDK